MDKQLEKTCLGNLIEPDIFRNLDANTYEIQVSEPYELLKWNRLITAFDIFYLNNKDKNYKLAHQVYFERVRSSTFDTFEEPGNADKNSYEAYCDEFDNIYESVNKHGFNKNKSLLPLARNGSIFNGSHRLASSIVSNKKVYSLKLDKDFIVDDYKVLIQRNVPINIVEIAVCEFIKYSKNVYLAFLWPSSNKHLDSTFKRFNNILYSKELELSTNGALNLLTELYKHMDWSGNERNSYKGINQKLVECFPSFEKFTVLAFQANSIQDVRMIKDEVRDICKIGYSSIHITDTHEEAIRISQLLFNSNSLHFLNYAKPYSYLSIHNKIEDFKRLVCEQTEYDLDDFVVDGSSTLSLYGLRESDDLDFLYSNSDNLRVGQFHSHDECLKYHNESKEDLIYNPAFYFSYLGLKFVSFEQTYKFKKERDEEKDKTDCALMDAYLENNKLKLFLFRTKQILFYKKIILERKTRESLFLVLQKVGLYNIIRSLYRRLKK